MDNTTDSNAKPDRGDATRQKLLLAATDVFGELGFDGASTRTLAEAAGVNLQAIPYYFGGKEGLYLAVAEEIAAAISKRVQQRAEFVQKQLAQAAETTLPANRARELLTDILQAMAQLFTSPESEAWARFMIREQMHPTQAFELVYNNVMQPLLGIIRELVAILLQQPADSQYVRLRTLSLVGSILIYRVARAAVQAQLEWETVGSDQVAAIQSLVVDLVHSIQPANPAS